MVHSLPLFGPLHLGMLFLAGFVILFILYWGKCAREIGELPKFSRQLGHAMLAIWIFYMLYNFSPARLSWEKSLPIEACDFIAFLAVLALLTPLRFPRSLLYFSGILLTGQAVLTPAGDQNPMTLHFWLYWGFHAGILAVSVFDFHIRSYRPFFRDLVCAWSANIFYLVLVLPLDICFGWNYGFLGNSMPGSPTLVDFLGPWPERIVVMFFGVCLAQALIMYLPLRLFAQKNMK